ncbi:MAG: glutathione S-transferase N-terminal domain-containing protein [Candidatus Aenigmarchaeota archaeon]|nr:glutathione S-transferase N-terminal domain-containing protein [Candidatus Aenigmarchaeota archaeon]
MADKLTVKVYSTQYCPWCTRAKDFLKEHNVEFEAIDVSADRDAAQYMVEKSGQTGVPVIQIGEEFIVGFDRERLAELLGIKE